MSSDNTYYYKSSFEGEFVRYYEKYFYHGKEQLVRETVDYIESYVDKLAVGHEMLVDVGCGTGIYAPIFAERYKHVLAIDISPDMVDYARSNHPCENIEYRVNSISEESPASGADVVVALSHVIGYMTDDPSLHSFFTNISASLATGGIVLFNFYYADAILNMQLAPRTTRVADGPLSIERQSNAVVDRTESVLNESYHYTISDDTQHTEIDIKEKMRFFSVGLIEKCLVDNGLEIVDICEFLTGDSLTDHTWNGFVVARKVD